MKLIEGRTYRLYAKQDKSIIPLTVRWDNKNKEWRSTLDFPIVDLTLGEIYDFNNPILQPFSLAESIEMLIKLKPSLFQLRETESGYSLSIVHSKGLRITSSKPTAEECIIHAAGQIGEQP